MTHTQFKKERRKEMNKIIMSTITILILLSFASTNKIQASEIVGHVMNVDQFNEAIKNNDLLKKLGKTDPLSENEKGNLKRALEFERSDVGGVVNRQLNDFKGNTLVIGGGKKDAQSPSDEGGGNRGITWIEKFQNEIKEATKLIEDIKSKSWTEENKQRNIELLQKEIEENQKKVDDILNTYYTVNIEKGDDPDLVASITSISDMSKIPDNYFQKVIFENVDILVWLNPNIFKILERITKPGGSIIIDGAVHSRLLVVAFAHTKWAQQINKQVENDVKVWPDYNRLKITLTN